MTASIRYGGRCCCCCCCHHHDEVTINLLITVLCRPPPSSLSRRTAQASTAPWQCQVTPRFYLYLPRISYRCQRVPRYVVTVERTRGPRETHSSRADGETHQAARAFSVPPPLARRGGTIARLFFMGFAVLRAPTLLTPTYIGRRLYGRCTFPRQDFSP